MWKMVTKNSQAGRFSWCHTIPVRELAEFQGSNSTIMKQTISKCNHLALKIHFLSPPERVFPNYKMHPFFTILLLLPFRNSILAHYLDELYCIPVLEIACNGSRFAHYITPCAVLLISIGLHIV